MNIIINHKNEVNKSMMIQDQLSFEIYNEISCRKTGGNILCTKSFLWTMVHTTTESGFRDLKFDQSSYD